MTVCEFKAWSRATSKVENSFVIFIQTRALNEHKSSVKITQRASFFTLVICDECAAVTDCETMLNA